MRLDGTWKEAQYTISRGVLPVFIKHFYTLREAPKFVDSHWRSVHEDGGAILVGGGPPVQTITVEELERLSEEGIGLPDPEPFYMEVIYSKSVTFETARLEQDGWYFSLSGLFRISVRE